MKKYMVHVKEVWDIAIPVRAKDVKEARQEAKNVLAVDDSLETEYSHTMKEDKWRVEEVT